MDKPKRPQGISNRRVLDRIRETDKAWGHAHDAVHERLGKLEKLAEAQSIVMEKLTEKLDTARMSEGMSERKLDAISALGKIVESLASATANQQKHTAQLLDTMLERASRNVMKTAAQEMAAKSVMKRRENKAANVSRETSGPDFVKSCEECRALLDGRQPAHTDDMMAHAIGNHLAQLRQHGLIAVS